MEPNPALGVLLHAIGGLAAASFYVPYKRVRGWSWESYWIVGGLFSWIFAPWIVASLTTAPDPITILSSVETRTLVWCYILGAMWGVGGLTYGLSMRYLGLSLGNAVALGFCAAFGTLIPPIYEGTLGTLFQSTSGVVTLAGVFICLGGIAVCGGAGIAKEKSTPKDKTDDSIKEFSFVKGLWVAIFAGVLSACMSFGISAGKPIKEAAINSGTGSLWTNTAIFIVVLGGGFTVNFLWCMFLNWKNGSFRDYLNFKELSTSRILANYLFSAIGGTTWYCQFMFYGMGSTQMGEYDFASWTLHMASIIIFANIWGLLFHEWRGAGSRAVSLLVTGVGILIFSTIVVGMGTYLKDTAPAKNAPPANAAGAVQQSSSH